MSSANNTTEQKRAAHALAYVKSLENKKYGKFVSYASAFPAQVTMNGLGQSMATLLAAGGRGKDETDPHYFLYEAVALWLIEHISPWKGKQPMDLLDCLVSCDQKLYLRAQVEGLAYVNWLKKFARALLEEKIDDKQSSNDQEQGS